MALSWKDPGTKQRRIASIRAERATPEAKERARRFNAARWSRPGERERLSEWNRRRWSDPAIRATLSAAIKAVQSTPHQRAHYSKMRTDQWANDPEYRARTVAGIRRSKGSPEARALFSMLLRERWKDPVWRAKWMVAVKHNAKLGGAARRKGGQKRVENVPLVPTFTQEERKTLTRARSAVLRMARRHKSTAKELAEIAAASDVVIKRFPAGAHSGWRPSWMGE